MNKRLLTFSFFSVLLFSITFGNAFLHSVGEGGTLVAEKLGAQVGVSVGVSPNEFSDLAEEITKKQEELQAREIAVTEKEKALAKREEISSFFSLEWYVTVMAFILLLLVLLNFYLDWRRSYYPRETVRETVREAV